MEIIKRDDVNLDVVLKDQDGNAFDLTGKTVFFTLKRRQDDSDEAAVVKKTVTVHTNASLGQTRIALSNTDTNQSVGYYFYDVQVKDVQNRITSAVKGQIRIVQDITIRIS